MEEEECAAAYSVARSGGAATPPAKTLAAEAEASCRGLLVRQWRRLALGAAMPCYLAALLPLLLGPGAPGVTRGSLEAAAEGRVPPLGPGEGGFGDGRQRQGQGPGTPLSALGAAGRADGGQEHGEGSGMPGRAGRGTGAGGASTVGSLCALELCSPCTQQLVRMLPALVAGPGRPGGARDVRLLLRLASGWEGVVGGLAALGGALRGVALLPTFLYGSGTMLPEEVRTVG